MPKEKHLKNPLKNMQKVKRLIKPFEKHIKEILLRGAKWQAERMFSEEDMKEAFNVGRLYLGREGDTNFEQLIGQFKNKQDGKQNTYSR